MKYFEDEYGIDMRIKKIENILLKSVIDIKNLQLLTKEEQNSF